MRASFRQIASINNSIELAGRRALTNHNAPVRRTLLPLHSLPSRHSFQTATKVCTAQSKSKPNRDADHNNLLNRESLKPSKSEGTQSGTDDEVASHSAPFDPHITAPEAEIEATARESAEQKKSNNPLDVSPGNREVNKARDPSKEPPESGMVKPRSTRGWTRKSRAVNQGK